MVGKVSTRPLWREPFDERDARVGGGGVGVAETAKSNFY